MVLVCFCVVLPGFGMLWWGPAWFWWVPPFLGRLVPVLPGNGRSRQVITPFRLAFGWVLAGFGMFWWGPAWLWWVPPSQGRSVTVLLGNDWKWPPKAINYAF